jgi:hypothetical protein
MIGVLLFVKNYFFYLVYVLRDAKIIGFLIIAQFKTLFFFFRLIFEYCLLRRGVLKGYKKWQKKIQFL